MRRRYRCTTCRRFLGYIYGDEILPPCPKGHVTQLVPEYSEIDLKRATLELQPNVRTQAKKQQQKDPLTARQRAKKGSTDGG